MTDDFFMFYRKKLSARNLILKKIPLRYWISPIIFILSSMFLPQFILNSRYIFIVFLLVIILMFLSVHMLNIGSKMVLKKEGEIEENYHWAGRALNDLRKKQLLIFLSSKDIKTVLQYKELEGFLKEKIEHEKYGGIFNLSIILAILIPVWNETLKKLNVVSFNYQQLLYVVLVLLVLLSIFGFMLRGLREVIDSFINKKSITLKEVYFLIKEIKIDFGDDLEKVTFEESLFLDCTYRSMIINSRK